MTEETERKLFESISNIEKRGERIERAMFGENDISEGLLMTVKNNSAYLQALKEEKIIEAVQHNTKYINGDKKLKNKIIGGVAVGTPVAVLLWERIAHFLGLK